MTFLEALKEVYEGNAVAFRCTTWSTFMHKRWVSVWGCGLRWTDNGELFSAHSIINLFEDWEICHEDTKEGTEVEMQKMLTFKSLAQQFDQRYDNRYGCEE